MMGKRLILVLVAVALLSPQFADCVSAMTPDHGSMKCCGSMPCTRANLSQGCCKNTTPAQTPDMVPVARVSLHEPNVATVEYPRTPEIVRAALAPALLVEAPQNSPPELYTLHASLLI